MPSKLKTSEPAVARLRAALKFSLWTWALYWPGGGLLLLYGGLNVVSIAVTLGSLGAFILLLATGALRSDRAGPLKQFLLERPLYLVAALVVLIVAAAVVPSIEGFGLLLFAALWFGGLGLGVLRLVEVVRARGGNVLSTRADQLLLVFALSGFFSLLVFLDALLPIVADGATLGSPAALVAVCTWMGLLYPGLVLVASRPFREPLVWPGRRKARVAAVRRRKATPEPTGFRAS